MSWLHNRKPRKATNENKDKSLPLLRIFALDATPVDQVVHIGEAPPVNVVGFMLKKGNNLVSCVIPTISRDGHVSFVLAGTLDDFHRMQEDISARFARRLGEIRLSNMNLTHFVVVGFTYAFPEDTNRMFLIYETLVSPTPIIEMGDVYYRLKSVTDSKNASELESYFADDMRKKWLNEVITRLENILGWPEFVTKSMKRTKTP